MEYLDIVTEKGERTGLVADRVSAHAKGIRHRTAHVWVIREKAGRVEVLLQKRAEGKDSFPGKYDTSSAGHIPAGDEPRPSAVRELSEELGIYVREADLQEAGTCRIKFETEFYGKPFKDDEVVFVYVLKNDVNPAQLTLQPEEVSEAIWLPLDEVQAAVAARDERFCVPQEGLELLTAFLGKVEKPVSYTDIRPGRYRHFKGNEYEVLGVARHSETEEPMVVYRALYGSGGLWVRPASMWLETVERDGRTYQRFTYVPENEA